MTRCSRRRESTPNIPAPDQGRRVIPEHSNTAMEIRRTLADPRSVCRGLGLDEGAIPQRRGLLIRCPWHIERTPSCSVRLADDGTIGVRCFACDTTGDVLDLVAVVNQLDPTRHFPEVIRRAAALAGLLPQDQQRPGRRQAAPPPSQPSWPPRAEVEALWASCRFVVDDDEVAAWLRSRALDPAAVDALGLARALPVGAPLPRWARCQGAWWTEGGHRCILPMFDHCGDLRSVRARRLSSHNPKGAPPKGYRVAGVVMADSLARTILATGRRPSTWPQGAPLRIVVAEGEPDFLTWSTSFSDGDLTAPAVIGVVSGSWSSALAARVPSGSEIIIRTDHDEAGERYAGAIHDSLADRCTVVRGSAEDCELCATDGWTTELA